MTTLEDIAEEVKAQGAKTFEAWELRDAYPADRLGRLVREGISSTLDGMGIGHWPREVPQYQNQTVRLYHKGTPTADLIEAVLQPSPESDALIGDAIQGESEEVLQKVRELVCD